MWATRDIIAESTRFQNRFDRSISDSDHTILALTIQLRSLIHPAKNGPEQLRSNSAKVKTIILEETSEEQWEEYKEKLDNKLKASQIRQEIRRAQDNSEGDTKREIKYLWNTFENLVI